ncbi:MAG: ribonuclease III [Holosporaceae bacterium]|jgi:ribonuclease III|nr:ribonuclease III [Holosporaceae bacterium]
MPTLDSVLKLQKIIGYNFRKNELIEAAIFHPGIKGDKKYFERLEFLGDRVLGLSLANFLYENFLDEREGSLAIRIANLAGTDFLIKIVKKTKIIDCLTFPKDFFISVDKNSSAIADMLEAILGAIFLDSNFETVKQIIIKLWSDDINSTKEKDFKTMLQEKSQAEFLQLPIYKLIKMTGEAHNPTFEIEVTACGESALGYGNSKKNAEHNAAKRLMEKIK